jgi:CubicO group peptidase (beta-lactamase class C family)
VASLPPLPPQPEGVSWPTEAWPEGDLSDHDAPAILAHIDHAFSPEGTAALGETRALAIVQGGRLIFERYGAGMHASSTHPSWSKAKSVTHGLTGVLVGDGLIDIHAPAGAPEWAGPDDPRGAITLDQLLRMSSGLKFNEVYMPDQGSDVIEMLFGRGKDDMAAFAASFPLAHAPDTYFAYASGATNIISRRLRTAIGAKDASFEAFMRERLFDPLGMKSPQPKFDAAGTFIGSSFCFATAQDFARFGLLYLRDGVWDGRRILPEGWVDYARTPTYQQPDVPDGPYGAHWWLGLGGVGSFSANGFEGQFTVVIPDIDMVIVRHGRTPLAAKNALANWMRALSAAFR